MARQHRERRMPVDVRHDGGALRRPVAYSMAAVRKTKGPVLQGFGAVIFVTVGSSEPFDRLICAVDEWAGLRGRGDVFAQVGRSRYRPRHIEAVQFLDPRDFRARVCSARVVVAHAGMGSIIMALEIGKPIVVMPRRAHLGETRSDHQFATAKQFAQRRQLAVAFDEQELIAKLDQAEMPREASQISGEASPLLISTIRAFIEDTETAKHRK